MCRTLSARSTIHPWSSKKSNPKLHSSWMSAIHMGRTASCDSILRWRSPFSYMGTFSPVTFRIDWFTGWMCISSCSDRTSGRMMEILLPVSIVIQQGCSSTLLATNKFSDPCSTPFLRFSVLNFSVGACVKVAKLCPASSATGSFPGPAQGWLQQEVYPRSRQWLVSYNFAGCAQLHHTFNK